MTYRTQHDAISPISTVDAVGTTERLIPLRYRCGEHDGAEEGKDRGDDSQDQFLLPLLVRLLEPTACFWFEKGHCLGCRDRCVTEALVTRPLEMRKVL